MEDSPPQEIDPLMMTMGLSGLCRSMSNNAAADITLPFAVELSAVHADKRKARKRVSNSEATRGCHSLDPCGMKDEA